MGVNKKLCSDCGEKYPPSNFYKNRRRKDGLDATCKRCRVIRNAFGNPRQRIRCGNGIKPCEKGCTRHRVYAGLEWFVFDEEALKTWLRENWFDGATVDRIDTTLGYVCRKGDTINSERFGNFQLVPWKDNHAKIRR